MVSSAPAIGTEVAEIGAAQAPVHTVDEVINGHVVSNTGRDGMQNAKLREKGNRKEEAEVLGPEMLAHIVDYVDMAVQMGVRHFDIASLASFKFVPSMKEAQAIAEAVRAMLDKKHRDVEVDLQLLVNAANPRFMKVARKLTTPDPETGRRVITSLAFPQSHDLAFLVANGRYTKPGGDPDNRDDDITLADIEHSDDPATEEQRAIYREHVFTTVEQSCADIEQLARENEIAFNRYFSCATGSRVDGEVILSNPTEVANAVARPEYLPDSRPIISCTEAIGDADNLEEIASQVAQRMRGRITQIGVHIHVLPTFSHDKKIALVQAFIRGVARANAGITDIHIEFGEANLGGCSGLGVKNGNIGLKPVIEAVEGMDQARMADNIDLDQEGPITAYVEEWYGALQKALQGVVPAEA